MQQLIAVWQALDTRRRMIVGGATIAMFAAILALSGMASKTNMALLYAGLEGAQAADIVTSLEQKGATYEVRGDAIYVDASRRDELRMTLAGEGLPATGGTGYELLDSLSGFGTTSQMFDAAYLRAKEGELARTIVSNQNIRSARVHIAAATNQPFRTDIHPTASITVTTTNGGLTPQHAKALKYLVASAVSGMSPDDVSVIDTETGLVGSGDDAQQSPAGKDKADELKRNVERLMAARVGYGKSVVEVAVETVTEHEAITERSFDPASRVAISTDTEEKSNKADETRPASVTVASNLPQGDAGSGDGKSSSQGSETREKVNYEVSETTRELVRQPGSVKRLTVAVLVDGVQGVDANGAPTWTPRSAEEMTALQDLVASAVGFNADRGDVITLKTLQFEPVPEAGTTVTAGMLSNVSLDMMSLIQLAVVSIVALVLGLFVLRPILTRSPAPQLAGLPAPEGAGAAAMGSLGEMGSLPALTGEIDDGDMLPAMTVVSDFDMGGMQMPMAMGNFGDDMGGGEDPVARLKRLISERQEETVEILRSWMEEPEEQA